MMTTSDRLRNALADFRAALGLLTRLPLPVGHGPMRGGSTAWAWPLVGVVIGSLAAISAILGLAVGGPPALVAGLVLGVQVMATGAMHEDGLADCADGFWGGWEKARRLAIMKDSHIGSYGVMSLIIITLFRWKALEIVVAGGGIWGVVGVAAVSRAPMAVLMAALPPAREGGLSRSVGQPGAVAAAIAVALALGIAFVFNGLAAIPMALAVAGVCLLLALLARAKIGGQTGDVLGASQQLAEMAALAVLASAV